MGKNSKARNRRAWKKLREKKPVFKYFKFESPIKLEPGETLPVFIIRSNTAHHGTIVKGPN